MASSSIVTSSKVTDNDRGAILTIAAALCICCVGQFLLVRLIIRRPWKELFGKDDLFVSIATVVGIVQSLVLIIGVARGLGRRRAGMSIEDTSNLDKFIYTSELLYAAACSASKLALALFLLRLSDDQPYRRICMGIVIVCCVFAAISILMLSLDSPLAMPWRSVTSLNRVGQSTFHEKHKLNPSQLHRWIGLECVSAIIDIVMAILPFCLIANLQMKRSRKIQITLSFALRLLLFPLAALRLRSFAEMHADSYDLVPSLVYLEIEMAYSVASTTIPCLRNFLEGASAHFLDGHNTYAGSTSRPTLNSSYELATLRSRRAKSHREELLLTKREDGESTAIASKAAERDRISVGSDCSQRAIMVHSGISVQYTQT